MKHFINRRRFLKIGALASASIFAGMKLSSIQGLSNLRLNIKDRNYHFKVGDFDCIAINDLNQKYQATRFFTNVPENILTEKLKKYNLRADYIPSPNSCLLVKTDKNLVLIDTGSGTGIHPETGPYKAQLLKSLHDERINGEDIDTVILSHGHGEHIGGNTNVEGYVNFPNAKFFMFNEEWRFWISKAAFMKQSKFIVEFARTKLIPIRDRIELLNFDTEILPGIFAVSAPGHTPGHMIIVLESRGKQLIYTADTVLHPIHLEEPKWQCGYDIDPQQAAITKQKIFNEKVTDKTLILAFHFHPFPSLGRIIKKEEGWEWKSM